MSETVRKPKSLPYAAECLSESPDDMGGGAFCVQLETNELYSAKDVRKMINWLEKAEKWIANKEQYRPRGRKSEKVQETV